MKSKNKNQVCIVCGIPWKDGKGFIGKHKFPCANDRYGWRFTKDERRKKMNFKNGFLVGIISGLFLWFWESIFGSEK